MTRAPTWVRPGRGHPHAPTSPRRPPPARAGPRRPDRWTRDLGPTDEDNLCLTCWCCHHRIHEDGWLVARDPGTGRFSVHPPDPLARPHRRRAG
ncbi:MAG: hypothetical protein ACRDYX_14445 [Egibacteraceae bacterium]